MIRGCVFTLCLICCHSLYFVGEASAERIFFAGYKGGFYIKSEEEGGMELRLGGAFQADYRYYQADARADNGFDIRRARLVFRGSLTRYFRFGLEYEFQGNETKNLVDAYGEAVIKGQHGIRMGQFKEPFSLEWQTRDKGLYFAERSMGYYLTPKRDIGLMVHGAFGQDAFNYALGLFNGDGVDGSSKGSEYDEPEIAARLVFSPFRNTSVTALNAFQIGASATYAKIDMSNVDLNVKTTGMAGSKRSIYVLGHNTKFGVLQDVGARIRTGLEVSWAYGPVAVQGEYIQLRYTDLEPVGNPARDANFSSWYLSALWSVTGELFVSSGGVLKPMRPERFFNPGEGTFGAVCLAARAEHFSGDEDWINKASFVSVEEADAVSIAVNWILFPMQRIILDYTYTDFSDPVRVRVNPDGSVDYVEKESVLTLRFSIDF